MGPLLFLAYVNHIGGNLDSTIKLFTDNCIIYRKIVNDNDIETLQIYLDIMGDWSVQRAMKINPGKSKAVSFTGARVKDSLHNFLVDQRIPQASSCNYLGII